MSFTSTETPTRVARAESVGFEYAVPTYNFDSPTRIYGCGGWIDGFDWGAAALVFFCGTSVMAFAGGLTLRSWFSKGNTLFVALFGFCRFDSAPAAPAPRCAEPATARIEYCFPS